MNPAASTESASSSRQHPPSNRDRYRRSLLSLLPRTRRPEALDPDELSRRLTAVKACLPALQDPALYEGIDESELNAEQRLHRWIRARSRVAAGQLRSRTCSCEATTYARARSRDRGEARRASRPRAPSRGYVGSAGPQAPGIANFIAGTIVLDRPDERHARMNQYVAEAISWTTPLTAMVCVHDETRDSMLPVGLSTRA